MKNMIIIGGLSALGTGILIGIQSMLSGQAGNLVGAINTGFWTNFLGGILAGLLILGVGMVKGFNTVEVTPPALKILLISGALGVLIIIGVSFSTSKAGVAAGLATIIWGQQLFGILADTYGWGRMEPIPLDMRRIIGTVLMFVSVILIMPRE